jgi:ubiquinone/menaquinone biosynthesis C-methylase UbiE
MSRVLKSEGFCLHIFPSKYKPIETHVFVPFSGTIQSYWWIYLWASFGIENEWKNLSIKDRSHRFYNYLKNETNYLSKKELKHEFRMKFEDVRFCEKIFNKYSPHRGKYLYSLSKIFPFIPSIFSTFSTRVIFCSLSIK